MLAVQARSPSVRADNCDLRADRQYLRPPTRGSTRRDRIQVTGHLERQEPHPW